LIEEPPDLYVRTHRNFGTNSYREVSYAQALPITEIVASVFSIRAKKQRTEGSTASQLSRNDLDIPAAPLAQM